MTQESVLPKAASPFSAAARTPSTFSRIHCTFPPEKYVAGRQAGLAPDHVAALVPVQRAGDAVGAGVLPDDRVVVGPAGLAVPDHRGLALIGDAERGQVGRRSDWPRSARSGRPTRSAPRSPPGCARPSRPAAGSARARADACATSFPEWSKIMNRVLVVPWSTAPTKSGMRSSKSRWAQCRWAQCRWEGSWSAGVFPRRRARARAGPKWCRRRTRRPCHGRGGVQADARRGTPGLCRCRRTIPRGRPPRRRG